MPKDPSSSSRRYRKNLLKVLRAFRRGDFAVSPPAAASPEDHEIAAEIDAIFELNRRLARQLQQISESVGKEGQIRQRANLGRVGGAWAASVGSLNTLIADLVRPTTEVARVIGAVA